MARKRNKNKRARTVSERQDYRQGGRVKKFTGGSPIRSGQMSRFRNLAREGQAELEELQRANKSTPAATPAPQPRMGQDIMPRQDIMPKGAKTGRPDVGSAPIQTTPTPSPAPQPAPTVGRIDTTIQPGSGFQDNQPQPPLRRGQDITLPGDKIGIGDEPVPAPSPTPPPRPTPSPEPEPTPPSTGGVQIGDRKDIAGEEHIWNGNAWIATGRQGGVYEDDGGAGGQVGIGDQDDEDVGGQEEDEDEEDTTPPPTPAPTPTPRGRELAEDILSGDFQAPQIPAVEEVPIGEDIPVYKIEEDFGIPMSEVATLPQPSQEQVQEMQNIREAGDPIEVQVKKILDVTTLPEDVAIKVATGELSPEAIAREISIARVGEIKAAEVEIEEGALANRVVGAISPEAKAVAAKNAGLTLSRVTRAKKQLRNAGLSEEDIAELGNDPEALEDRALDFTEQQRGIIEGLPEEALVSNQIDSLLSGIEEGEIPAWARPAVAAVEARLAQRGMSASTVGRDALLNSIIQSALPIAQSNAQAIQQSVSQQRSIEAQAFEADAQRQQQAALTNANNVFQMDMAQFSADQQTALANSRFLQTVSLTEASNRQQAAVQNAVLMSQANIAEANLFQQAQIANAKNFLAMDMANLSNTQQSFMLEAQQEQQRMLSNQAALNAAEQFNAASDMQVEQFNANLASNVEKFNAGQINSAKQFNAAAQNAAEARRVANEMEVAKSNAMIVNDINKYNSQVAFERDRFNVANQQAITQSNFEWRRKANLADTAVQNQINMQNAMNAYNLNTASLSFIWQELRDDADRQWRHEENELNRKNALIQQAIDNASAIGKHYSSYSNIVDMIGDIFD
jgi:hypothetical protein